MPPETQPPANPKWMTIVGWVLTVLLGGSSLLGSTMNLMQNPDAIKGLTEFGYPASVSMPLGIVVLIIAVLYLIPRTSVLGAILMTGYMGGAVATHVRADDGMFYFAVIAGVLVWLGLYLRDPRVRDLVPLRK